MVNGDRGTVIYVDDPERAAEWEKVVGTTTLYVKSPLPRSANLPGRPGSLIYELDVDLLMPEQKDRLIEHLSEKFGQPRDVVATLIQDEQHGVPILAEDVSVSISHPQRWFT